MLCPIKVLIELTVHTSCFWVLDLLCVTKFTVANNLTLFVFGIQQLTNELDKEGDLMRFNTYENILYEV